MGRSFERDYIIAELVHLYQLNDKTWASVIKIILDRAESQLAKGYLCNFLFHNNHRRWNEFLSVLNGYTHLAVPLLKTLLRYNSATDVIAYWDVLLKSARLYFLRKRRAIFGNTPVIGLERSMMLE